MKNPLLTRRQWLLATAALGSAVAQAAPSSSSHNLQNLQALRGVTLRIGTDKGLWRPLLQASGQADTPDKVDWREFNNGVLDGTAQVVPLRDRRFDTLLAS